MVVDPVRGRGSVGATGRGALGLKIACGRVYRWARRRFALHHSLVATKLLAMMDAMAILADPTRRAILQMVWGREVAAGKIAASFDVTAGAISQHLAKLRETGLVRMRRAGRNWFYEADLDALGPLAPALEAMWRSKLDELRALAEAEQRAIDEEGAA